MNHRQAALLPDTLARSHAKLISLKIEPAFAERSGVMLMRQGSNHAATQVLKTLLTEDDESWMEHLKGKMLKPSAASPPLPQ